MIMPTMEILHLCWGTWCCWLQKETGYRLRGWVVYCTPRFPPACGAQEFWPEDCPVCQPSLPPKNKQCWWYMWLPSDKRTSQSLVCPEFHKLPFFPARFRQAAKDGEKDAGIGSGASPTDQQPEIQLVNWTSWKPNPQRIHREMNSRSWTQADFGSMLHTRVNMTLL